MERGYGLFTHPILSKISVRFRYLSSQKHSSLRLQGETNGSRATAPANHPMELRAELSLLTTAKL